MLDVTHWVNTGFFSMQSLYFLEREWSLFAIFSYIFGFGCHDMSFDGDRSVQLKSAVAVETELSGMFEFILNVGVLILTLVCNGWRQLI